MENVQIVAVKLLNAHQIATAIASAVLLSLLALSIARSVIFD